MRQKISKSGVWQAFSVWVILALILGSGSVLMAPSPVGAATWYVDGTLGTDDGAHGTGPGINAFKTIQYSINDPRIGDSDTINVAAGDYYKQIHIKKKLTTLSFQHT